MLMLSDYRSRQRDYLLEIIRALTQELDLTALLGRILKISIEMLSGQAGLIALRSDAGEWSVPVSQNLPQPFINYLHPYFADLPATSDPETAELPEISRVLTDLTRSVSMGMLGGFGLPLVARQQVVGVIFIFRGGADSFSPNDRALLRSFADQAAIAVQNAQLYTQVSQEKQRMDALLDSAADGILILSSSRTIERCNPALLRLLDIKNDAILLKKHDEVIQLDQPPAGLDAGAGRGRRLAADPARPTVRGRRSQARQPGQPAGRHHLRPAALAGWPAAQHHCHRARYHPLPAGR